MVLVVGAGFDEKPFGTARASISVAFPMLIFLIKDHQWTIRTFLTYYITET